MNEPNFRPGMRGLNNREELLAYCMDDVNVLRQACCAFRNLFLKLVKMDPFPDLVSETRFCRYYPERGLPYGGSSVC